MLEFSKGTYEGTDKTLHRVPYPMKNVQMKYIGAYK